MELLHNRYLLHVTRCRKLMPEGVEVVIEIRPKSQVAQELPPFGSAANASNQTPQEVQREP
jgi:hypothetical protein